VPQPWKTCLLLGSAVSVNTDEVFCGWKKGKYQCCYGKHLKDFLYTIVLDSHIEMLNSKHGKCREGIPKRAGMRNPFCERQFNSLAHLAQQKKAERRYDYSWKIYLQSKYHRGRRDSTKPVVCKLKTDT